MERIYLIGYMGVGKTTIGKELSKLHDLSFIDLDKFIENKYHKTVPQLFAEKGEDVFRELERKCLLEVSDIEDVVVSTGGGTPCFFDNMAIMNETGISVYIQATPLELVSRLQASKNVRPIVSEKNAEELLPFITRHLSERDYFYNQAHIIFPTNRLITKKHISVTVIGISNEIKKLQANV